MRTETDVHELLTIGALEEGEFTIEESAKTFKMLFDGLYSDKTGSIVREVASNAWDSQQRAGYKAPFYVHAPTAINPDFWVRDFGAGMDHQTVLHTYTRVGKSTKVDTDTEVGMWGLGSKSPFAHGDQFSVDCYDGQEVRHYTCAIGETGRPRVLLMGVEPCAEPCGVRVGFAVEQKDFAAFESAIRKASAGFPEPFESNITLPLLTSPIFHGADWQAYDNDRSLNESLPAVWNVRQGCVVYPLTAQRGVALELPTDYKRRYVLDCPIGTIKFTTSREQIAYTPEVVEYLRARLAALVDEVGAAVWAEVSDIQNVAAFFAKITQIKPDYVKREFVHPATGLRSTTLVATAPTLLFRAKRDGAERWDFRTESSLSARTGPDTASPPMSEVFIMGDIVPLLDPTREATAGYSLASGDGSSSWLTKSEMRRISRFTRAFLEKRGARTGLFAFGVDWSQDFLNLTLPATARVEVTLDQLRDSVPRHVMPPQSNERPAIRGVALAKAAGEQKPVFEITPDHPDAAWVSSEQYRRAAVDIFKLGKRFGLQALYIASATSQPLVVEARIPSLRDKIEAELAGRGVTLPDWFAARDLFSSLSTSRYRGYFAFLMRVHRHAPDLYAKLETGDDLYAIITRGAKPFTDASLLLNDASESKGADAIVADDAGKRDLADESEAMKATRAATDVISNNTYNPLVKWIDALDSMSKAEDLRRAVEAFLSIQALFPASEKFTYQHTSRF